MIRLSIRNIFSTLLETKIFISSPLSFETQLWPKELDDLAHGLIDITLFNASHKTLQKLHGEELAFFTQPRAN